MRCPLLWRLYLPAVWLADPQRRAAGRIPEARPYQSKNELALGLIDQALGWALPRRPVVADSAEGKDFDFRQALRPRGLPEAVAVEPTTKVWTADPNQIPVPAGPRGGRPRTFVPLAALPEPHTLAALAGGIGRPGTPGGAGVGSLRGASLAGLAPSCDAGVAGLCVPASGTGAR